MASETSPTTDAPLDASSARTEMAMRRTGMSFQRTRMSAERTLMAVVRTSLSLITFGFAIAQFFRRLKDAGTIAAGPSAKNFGVALVSLGILMLILGIVYHLQFMYGLRRERRAMTEGKLIYGQSVFPISLTLVTALSLLLIGVAAVVSLMFQAGPFD